MTQYHKVEIPMLQVIPLRQAKVDMVLEHPAFDREGRVIADAGQTLTDDLIRKFKNLDVRKLVVTETVTQWKPQEEAEQYSDNVSVVETREFGEAAEEIVEDLQATQSVEKLRKTALYLRKQAKQAGDSGGVTFLNDIIDRSYELEEEIETLHKRLKNVEDDEARKKLLEALEGKIRQLDQVFMELSAPESIIKETVDAVTEVEEMRSSLSDFVSNNTEMLEVDQSEIHDEDLDVEIPGSNEVASSIETLVNEDIEQGMEELLQAIKSAGKSESFVERIKELKTEISDELELKEELKKRVTEFDLTLEQRKMLTAALDGEETFQKSELFDLPIPDDFARKTYQLMQDELDSRNRLWEAANEAIEEDLSDLLDQSAFIDKSRNVSSQDSPDIESDSNQESGDFSKEQIDSIRESLEDEDEQQALDKINRILDESNEDKEEQKEKISQISNNLEELSNELDKLKKRVEIKVDDEAASNYLMEVLNRDRELNSDELFELEAPVGLLEDVADYVTQKEDAVNDIYDEVENASGASIRETRVLEDDQEPDPTSEPASSDDETEEERSTESDTDDDSLDLKDASYTEIVNKLDDHELADEFNLELSTVKTAQDIIVPPNSLTEEQEEFCQPLIEEAHGIFYGRELDDDKLELSALDLTDKMVDHDRPLNMLLDPPAGDSYILSHGVNTCTLAMSLADKFQFDHSEILDLAASSLSLDFGMVEVPPTLWAKDESLTKRADQEVRKHPGHSKGIVDTAANSDDVIQDLVHQHHERSDGSGYPQGLEGGNLHSLAPVLGTVDAYVAMMEPRAYRAPKSPDVAMTILLRNRDEFDPSVVKALVETIGIYPNGSVNLLSDGRIAMVSSQNLDSPMNPIVLILTDKEGNRLSQPVKKNLEKNDLTIEEIVKW